MGQRLLPLVGRMLQLIRLARAAVVAIAALLFLSDFAYSAIEHRPDVAIWDIGELIVVGVIVLGIRRLRGQKT